MDTAGYNRLIYSLIPRCIGAVIYISAANVWTHSGDYKITDIPGVSVVYDDIREM